MRIRTILREPLLHFLVLGGLLFLWYQWSGGGSGPGSNRIVLTGGRVASLAAGFEKTWQRPPTDAELKGLVDDYVREEIATREAAAAGLDQDDTIIRRRLRQKLEFLAEEAIDSAPPGEAELQAWLDGHADAYRSRAAARVPAGLRQPRSPRAVGGGRRARAAAEAREGRPRRLDRGAGRLPDAPGGGRARAAARGRAAPSARSSPTPSLALAAGRAGRVRSSRATGCTSCCVRERIDGTRPELPSVRPEVERDFVADRAQAAAGRDVRAPAREVHRGDRAAGGEAGGGRAGEEAPAPRPSCRCCSRSRRRSPSRTRPGPGSSSCAETGPGDLQPALEDTLRRRGRDPDRARHPGGLPARDARSPADHAGSA